MTDSFTAFPQHRAGRRKPTVAEIMIGAMTTQEPPMAMFQRIATAHPDVTQSEIDAAFAAAKAEVAKRQSELGSMEALMAVVKPIMREFGNKKLTTGQALKIAADRGDERAKAYLAYFESAEVKAWERDFKAAAALDPYWTLNADGSATRHPGARHKTAEDLVAAYRANQLAHADPTMSVEDLINAICEQARQACGVDPDELDDDDTASRRVTEVCNRIAQAHPRWAEIQRFFAEQGVREEIRRQCQEGGIPVIED
jgi:hypothetical protein